MQRKHTRLARAFHWGVLALYIYGVAKQLDDVSQLADDRLLLTETVFAVVFLVVVLARYGYMRRFPTFHAARTPIEPQRARLARAFHQLLYLCFVLLPISGLCIGALYSAGSRDGWGMDAAVGLHEFCADASYWLIALHVIAAIASRLKLEGVWTSMVPVWREPPPRDT